MAEDYVEDAALVNLQDQLQEKDRIIHEKTRELQGKDEELRVKTQEIGRLLLKREKVIKYLVAALCLAVVVIGVCGAKLVEQKANIAQLQSYLSYTCHVSGPGLSATANYRTHVIVELSDALGQPCSLRQNVTAELQSVDQSSVVPTTVSMRSPSQYEVSYTALSRGQHKLHVRLNGSEVSDSPFNITVYPDPTQLGTPVRVVTGLKDPWGIAINSHGEMVVSIFLGHTVTLLDGGGKEIQTYGSEGYRPEQMRYPTGVAVDSDDNVYVASEHKLQKFSRDGHLIKCVGQNGSEDGRFQDPKGIKLHQGRVYVCDKGNNRIQVLDADLNFIQVIGSPGSGRGEFQDPYDLDFDSEGMMYISDKNNHRIQVIDTSGQFVREFGQEEGEGKLERPSAVHVMGQFVYVSNESCDRICVYQTTGQFLTLFGKDSDVKFGNPYAITSDQDGLIYVPDFSKRIQIFQ